MTAIMYVRCGFNAAYHTRHQHVGSRDQWTTLLDSLDKRPPSEPREFRSTYIDFVDADEYTALPVSNIYRVPNTAIMFTDNKHEENHLLKHHHNGLNSCM